MFIQRFFTSIDTIMPKGKILIIYGPRRVGKTTLLKMLLKNTKLKYKIDSGDNIRVQEVMSSKDFRLINEYASGYDMLVIDEAQNIPDIGMGLKILIDENPKLQIIATGSSSFNLSQKIGEPLTGRKRTITLFPFSQSELTKYHNAYELKEQLENFLIYGTYPEVYTSQNNQERKEILIELIGSYLLKDILSLEKVKNPLVLHNLLKLLAFQVGNQVSVHELAVKLSVNVRTVSRYLDLLEKAFVIFRLNAFSKNLRNEIAKKSKYYFYDNGIRNAVIMQFNSLDYRNDIGALWENFLIAERLKYLSYKRIFTNCYFWRNYKQKEIDYIEEYNGELHAYELKWKKAKAKFPDNFKNKYSVKSFSVINNDNYLDFLL